MDESKYTADMRGYLAKYIDIAQKIIKAPSEFYHDMPKSGGFIEPLTFMIVMGIVAGIVRSVLGILGIGMSIPFSASLASIVIVPFFAGIFGFIGAAILLFIWKSMGSQEPYEVAFRCLAYAAAITPVTAVLHVIPYAGHIVGLVWMTYLLVNASTEVHHIEARRAWMVFGVICAVFAVLSVSTQYASRRMVSRIETLQQQMRK